MNWRCNIGLHDWEYISKVRSASLRLQTINPGAPIQVSQDTSSFLFSRVCVRCAKHVDTIKPAIKRALLVEYERQQRLTLAKKISEENAGG